MLSKTVSLSLSKECNAQAIGGRCNFSGCHMWISSLEAMSHQGLLPTPVLGEPSWEEVEHNKHIPCSQVLHLFLQVRSIRIYKSILLNGFHTSQGQCAISHFSRGHQGQKTCSAKRRCWATLLPCAFCFWLKGEQMTGIVKMNSLWRKERKWLRYSTLRSKWMVDLKSYLFLSHF